MTRPSGRAAATRQGLLAAARTVFAGQGYAESSIVDVVTAAGASVGSLYHHFGGKADLYSALYEDFQARQEERATGAVRAARSAGERDPVLLFVAGARAYLSGCWTERDLAGVFLTGGGPPGFDLVVRRRFREWAQHNADLLRGRPAGVAAVSDEALALVLTTVAGQAGAEVAVCEDEERALRLVDDVCTLVARIATPPARLTG